MTDVAALDPPMAALPDLIPVFNPSTEERIGEVPDAGAAAVDRAVARARDSFTRGVWKDLPAARRAEVLWRAADLIRERADEIAAVEAIDNGMSRAHARNLVLGSCEILYYYAGWVTKIHGDAVDIVTEGGILGRFQQFHGYSLMEPIGVVGLIIPWNGPFYVAICKIAPALAAGCSAVLKPAEETPLSALKIEAIFRDAGVPEGVLTVVTGYGETTGAALAAHPDVNKISFTGSTEVGKILVRAAAGNLKRLQLELGGKSPLVMFDDADLARAIPGAALGLLVNSGQNCCCTSRMYVQRGIYDEVVERIAEAARGYRMGGSEDRDVDLGPLISARQRDRVLGIVGEGVARGAEVVTGGRAMDRPGYFVEPTILTGTTPDMRLVTDEIFGPVGSIIPFDEEEEALAQANDSEYGLAATVWTENIGRAHRLAKRIQSGLVWINCALAADQSLPFGGYKQSGWGHERGWKGLEAYMNTKSVYVGL